MGYTIAQNDRFSGANKFIASFYASATKLFTTMVMTKKLTLFEFFQIKTSVVCGFGE